ncbi:MAG: hypothetical protein QOJ99_872, partial [Bryobacterales bacterium]|nr:hypothetical protein [Bryobacterales bacterium]
INALQYSCFAHLFFLLFLINAQLVLVLPT